MEKAAKLGIKFIEHFKKNVGWWIGGAVYCLTVFFFYITISQGYIFETYDKKKDRDHQKSVEYRMKSTPIIINYLNNLALETHANRVFIMEYHNGKSNSTGLQWQFADLTFSNDNTEHNMYNYVDMPLTDSPHTLYLHKHTFFVGDTNELRKLDKKLALRLESNDYVYIAMMMIYGANLEPIGYLALSFLEKPLLDKDHLNSVIHKYSTAITPYLDASSIDK
jgi:hypothetical protein